MPRLYRIPFGTVGTALMSLPPVALCIVSMALANNPTKLVSIAGIALGLVIYWLRVKRQTKGNSI